METVQGVIHGNRIELSKDLGLPDGQTVEVTVRPKNPSKNWGDGIRASAGALADEPQETFDILDRIIAERKNMKFREIVE